MQYSLNSLKSFSREILLLQYNLADYTKDTMTEIQYALKR